MKRHKSKHVNKSVRRGAALIIAMIFMAVFSSLSLAMFTMSSANVQITDNQHQGNRALANAESGLEVLRYWLDEMDVSATNLAAVRDALVIDLVGAGATNITVAADDPTDPTTLSISAVALDSQSNQTFSAVITQPDADTIQVDVTGLNGQFSRTIRANFSFATTASSIFDHAIATNGPLQMTGQSSVDGVNFASEANVYIDAGIVGDSFDIGNQASLAGDIYIVDTYATYDIGNQATVGGVSGEAAHEHVTVGADALEFPTPNTSYFEQFATGDVINSETQLSSYDVLNNATIAADTNPTFAGSTAINGILFVEQPNRVMFTGQVTIQGIIVCDSEVGDESPDNSVKFTGQVQCLEMSELTGAEFDAIKNETGTFLLAPGFSADFSGQANVINGVIAVAGARFTGQAGGTISGSIINYSDRPVRLQGQTALSFDLSGMTGSPTGFAPVQALAYDATSYSEVH